MAPVARATAIDPISAGWPMYEERIRQGLTVVQHMGQPADVGSIAVALATGAMAFATGQAIQADGGLLISRF